MKNKPKTPKQLNENITFTNDNIPRIWFFGDGLGQGEAFKLKKPSPIYPLWLTSDITYAHNYAVDDVCFVLFFKPDLKLTKIILDFRPNAERNPKDIVPDIPQWLIDAFRGGENLYSLFTLFNNVEANVRHLESIEKLYKQYPNKINIEREREHYLSKIKNSTRGHFIKSQTSQYWKDFQKWCIENIGESTLKKGLKYFERGVHDFLFKCGVGGYINIDTENGYAHSPVLVLLDIDDIELISVKALDVDVLLNLIGGYHHEKKSYYDTRLKRYNSPRLRAKTFINDYKKEYISIYGDLPNLL